MVEKLDPRRVVVSVEIDGKMNVYEDLNIVAKGQKTANPLQNTCEVTLTNLTKDHRNYLLTETSPFNKNKTPKRLIVEAGRVSTGLTRLFYGEITTSEPTQPPDIGLNMKAQTGAHAKGKVVSRSHPKHQSLKSIAGRVAKDLGASLRFEATDRQIANHQFSGASLRQVDALAKAGGVDCYLDDETLVVKHRAIPITGATVEVSQDTGLIGLPEVTEKGIKIKMLLNNQTVVGGGIQLKSKLNPSLDGLYAIYQLDFEIANRATEFYFIATCERH